MKEINNLNDLQPDGKYLILDEATDERWIVDIGDNYKPGQKSEEFEVFYKVLSTNTDRKIEDSEGDSSIECFIEENRLRAFTLEGEEPDVKSEDINREIIKQKKWGTGVVLHRDIKSLCVVLGFFGSQPSTSIFD